MMATFIMAVAGSISPGPGFCPAAPDLGEEGYGPIADPRDHPFTLDPPGGRKLTIWSTEAMALSRLRSSSFSAKDR